MATQISPYLTFNGNCREAMTYYKKCFGGDLTLQTVSETPIADQCPAGLQDHIMHAMLANDGFILMATDMTRPEGFKSGNDMAVSLNFNSEKEIKNCYKKLSQGGKILDVLKVSFWGSLFGTVQDKFGKVWMLNFDKNQTNQTK